jgi:hypothetical protein
MFLFMTKSVIVSAALLLTTNTAVRVYNDDFGKNQKQSFKKNMVKAVTGYTFVYTNGTPTKSGVKSSQERFDQKGNRVEEVWYDEKGTSFLESSYSYNEEGIELKNIGVRAHKPFYNNWLYEFNDTTHSLVKYHQQFQLNKEKWVCNYDASGNKLQEQYFDEDGLMLSRRVFKYDAKGCLQEKVEFDGYDNLYRKWVYGYDANGNNISEQEYNADSEIIDQYSMKYDDKGNLTTRFEMNGAGATQRMTVFLYEFYTASR